MEVRKIIEDARRHEDYPQRLKLTRPLMPYWKFLKWWMGYDCRGDLGVEIQQKKFPLFKKRLLTFAAQKAKL